MRKILIISLAALMFAACGKEGGESGKESESTVTMEQVKITPDRTSIIKNPLTGWVMYVGRNWSNTFWSEQGYDAMLTGDGTVVKVSDYATCAYLRTSWRNLEPTEGNYVWKDSNSNFSKLVKSLKDRGLKMSFRIVVDGRDQGLNTPEYVFDAGCSYYTDGTHLTWKCPYPEDPIFQEKYAKFIKALAAEFNDPDKTEFIDAYGLTDTEPEPAPPKPKPKPAPEIWGAAPPNPLLASRLFPVLSGKFFADSFDLSVK